MSELLEVTLVQTYFQQQTINRFNYVASGTPASVSYSFGLIWALGAIPNLNVYDPDSLMMKIAGCQDDGVTFTGITALNVYSDTDFYSTGFNPPLTGQNAGEGHSPVLSLGFRTTRVRRDIRRGQKRFSGLPEQFTGPGGIFNTADAPIQALRVALGETLTYDDEGNTLTYQPAIVKKKRYEVDGDPNRIAYKYIPEAEGGKDAQLLDTATGFSWEVYQQARTQNSRQYGRGI